VDGDKLSHRAKLDRPNLSEICNLRYLEGKFMSNRVQRGVIEICEPNQDSNKAFESEWHSKAELRKQMRKEAAKLIFNFIYLNILPHPFIKWFNLFINLNHSF
jgi:hypothetical protein